MWNRHVSGLAYALEMTLAEGDTSGPPGSKPSGWAVGVEGSCFYPTPLAFGREGVPVIYLEREEQGGVPQPACAVAKIAAMEDLKSLIGVTLRYSPPLTPILRAPLPSLASFQQIPQVSRIFLQVAK